MSVTLPVGSGIHEAPLEEDDSSWIENKWVEFYKQPHYDIISDIRHMVGDFNVSPKLAEIFEAEIEEYWRENKGQ